MPCIIDNNKVVLTPIQEIVDALQQQLYLKHINKLAVVERKQNFLRVTCPVHKGGHERTPSCSVLLEDTITNGRNIPAGTVHCFGCGYKTNIVGFVADCMGISYRRATEWLLTFVNYDILEEVRDIGEFVFEEEEKNNYNELPIITVNDLKQYDYIHEYMFKRHLTPDIIEKFEVGYSPKDDALTFPVYVGGRCLFVAKRKVKYKRFDMPPIFPKPIYGLDYVDTSKEVYVCESIINALTLCSYGLQAVALFGTGSQKQVEMLNKTGVRKFIICLDGDEAGKKGTKRLLKGLKDKIVLYKQMPDDGRDINDLTKEEFFALEEYF